MAITFASAVQVGDFIWIKDYRAQARLRDFWWKVVQAPVINGTADTFPLLVNRYGERARYTGQHVKVNRWLPGEDRRDPRDQ